MLKQYIGSQSFWNEHAVNDREKYYYSYGGYYGDGVEPQQFYRTLKRSPIHCDALTQDCWSNGVETFNGGGCVPGLIFIILVLLLIMKKI